MLDVGAKVTNPRSGSEKELLELEDARFVLRYTLPERSAAPDFAEHYHVAWHEEFRLLSGEASYRLGGKDGTLRAGESVQMPEFVPHLHPMSVGAGPAVMEQSGTLTDPPEGAVRKTLGVSFSIFDWDAQGRIALDSKGLPRHPMKLALAGRILGGAGGYDARIAKAAADAAGATVGRLAEVLGYQMIDPRWR